MPWVDDRSTRERRQDWVDFHFDVFGQGPPAPFKSLPGMEDADREKLADALADPLLREALEGAHTAEERREMLERIGLLTENQNDQRGETNGEPSRGGSRTRNRR